MMNNDPISSEQEDAQGADLVTHCHSSAAGKILAEPPVELNALPTLKARMPREDRMRYMVRIYLRRLKDTKAIMAAFLEARNGATSEIKRRMGALDKLIALVRRGDHKAAVEFIIKNGINNSLLQGGGGYPSLTGAHFDYIVTAFPNRTAEMRELIAKRRMTAWSQKDRVPKLGNNDYGKAHPANPKNEVELVPAIDFRQGRDTHREETEDNEYKRKNNSDGQQV